MNGGILKVNPQLLQSAGASFAKVGDGLAGMQADVPLGDAAGAVAQLQTAQACRKAQPEVAAAVTTAIESVRKFADNLNAAARVYVGKDESGADAIKGVEIPS